MSTPRPTTDRNPSETTLNSSSDTSSAELTQVVDDLLNQINTKFSTVSSELLAKSTFFMFTLADIHGMIQYKINIGQWTICLGVWTISKLPSKEERGARVPALDLGNRVPGPNGDSIPWHKAEGMDITVGHHGVAALITAYT